MAAQNQIYPNPFNTSTTINIDFPVSLVASNTFTIKVLDQLGNEVSNQVAYTAKESNKGSSITINNLSLSNGIMSPQKIQPQRNLRENLVGLSQIAEKSVQSIALIATTS